MAAKMGNVALDLTDVLVLHGGGAVVLIEETVAALI